MIGFENHDHKHCIATGIAAADAHCRSAGLQLTEARQRVLKILLEEHRALGAYEILDILGKGATPPTAYRALDFLVKHGFAHRIERLNAFIACAHPGETHSPTFLICRGCDAVAEAPSEPTKGRLGQVAKDVGFQIERAVVEAIGLCPKCLEAAQ
ncbi:transcriptional repressor [Rhodobacteraceae bacterium]|nr:transcriptional repressor [Paracoccaceae bacterium]